MWCTTVASVEFPAHHHVLCIIFRALQPLSVYSPFFFSMSYLDVHALLSNRQPMRKKRFTENSCSTRPRVCPSMSVYILNPNPRHPWTSVRSLPHYSTSSFQFFPVHFFSRLDRNTVHCLNVLIDIIRRQCAAHNLTVRPITITGLPPPVVNARYTFVSKQADNPSWLLWFYGPLRLEVVAFY